MKNRFRLSDGKIALLKRIFIVCVVLDALTLTALAFSTGALVSHASQVKTQLAQKRRELEAMPKLTKESMATNVASAVVQNPIAQVQSDFVKFAAQNGAKLGEFQTSAECPPFLSAYSHQTTQSSWNQIAVKVEMSGSLRAIVNTITDIRHTHALIESDSLEMSRKSFSGKSDVDMTTTFSFRVLVPGGKK